MHSLSVRQEGLGQVPSASGSALLWISVDSYRCLKGELSMFSFTRKSYLYMDIFIDIHNYIYIYILRDIHMQHLDYLHVDILFKMWISI